MMDQKRLLAFRHALDGLIESLDAFVRIARLPPGELPSADQTAAAGLLVDRLGAADRYASSRPAGTPNDLAKFDALRSAMKRLDAAYLAYRRQSASPGDASDALARLEAEVAATRHAHA